uniref:exo-beta-N-acetylmuramidase NamZ domain-containing protein n=1 Tax=Bacteroides graminisolvens TaxID=477666 RepID=UPI0023F3CB2A
MRTTVITSLLFCITLCTNAQKTNNSRIAVGAEQTSEYFPILKNKKIAVFSNHTGMIGNKHTIDVLLENKQNVVAIFSPEHGFRGNADAGEHVSSSVDS